jgi:hypothetical protein
MNAQVLHVLPTDDLIDHEEIGDGCVCGPLVQYFSRGRVVVHHALDGRHAADPSWAAEKAREIAAREALDSL